MRIVYLGRIDPSIEAAAIRRAETLLQPEEALRHVMDKMHVALDNFGDAICAAAERIRDVCAPLLAMLCGVLPDEKPDVRATRRLIGAATAKVRRE